MFKFQREAAREVASLLTEGYIVVWGGRLYSYYVRLRHVSNGNKISIYADDDCFILRKNGKVVKRLGSYDGE